MERSSLSERIYADLRHALMSGAYEPGARLNIRKLAVAHETSVTPVREAVMQLVREGALDLQLGHQARVPVLQIDLYIQNREVRVPLERLAAELAAVSASDVLIASLAAANDRFLDAQRRHSWKEALAANQEFHFLIYRASGNDVLVRTIENLWLITGPFINNQYPAVTDAQAMAFPHALIIDALQRHAPNEAGDLIVQDTRQGSALILQHLRQPAARRRARRTASTG